MPWCRRQTWPLERKRDSITRGGGRIMPEITYAQLDKMLSSLGFKVGVVTTTKKLRVYEQLETGARLALAFRPDNEAVLPHHLAAIQGTLKVYGIADPLNSTAAAEGELKKRGRPPAMVSRMDASAPNPF